MSCEFLALKVGLVGNLPSRCFYFFPSGNCGVCKNCYFQQFDFCWNFLLSIRKSKAEYFVWFQIQQFFWTPFYSSSWLLVLSQCHVRDVVLMLPWRVGDWARLHLPWNAKRPTPEYLVWIELYSGPWQSSGLVVSNNGAGSRLQSFCPCSVDEERDSVSSTVSPMPFMSMDAITKEVLPRLD